MLLKISKDKYDKINDRLSDFNYNLNALTYSIGGLKLTDKGKSLQDSGFVAGYLTALADLDIDYFARLDGEVRLDPSCVINRAKKM